MSLIHDLKIGKWYENADSQSFKVIGVDEKNQTIEIQYLDGALDYIDFDAWHTMEVDPIVPPKDWEGLSDDKDYDEYMDDESWDDESELIDKAEAEEI